MSLLLLRHARGFAVRTDGKVTAEVFQKFLTACRTSGLQYDPMGRAHLGTPLQLPPVIQQLERLRVPYTLQDGLAEHVLAEAHRMDGVSAEAARRAESAAERAGGRLWPYQRVGAGWLAGRRCALLADEMGLGKTVQALCALPEEAAVLVVAPAAVQGNWVREAIRWRPDLKAGHMPKKAFRAPRRGELLVTSYGRLPTEAALPTSEDLDAVHLVMDEAHMAKSGKALRTLRARALGRRCRAIWALTGTPLLNRPDELWAVLVSAGVATEAFGNWPTFVSDFQAHKKRWGGYEWGKPKPDVTEKLRRVMLRRIRTEVLPDLPRKVRTFTEVGIAADASKELDKIVAELRAKGIDLQSADLELLSGPIGFELMSRARSILAAAKTPAAEEFAAEYEEQELPVLVFAAHLAPLHVLGKRPGWGMIVGETPPLERTRLVDEFQAGRMKGLALSYAAGGVGITLTRAAHVMSVDLPWTPALLQQAEDRACRIGQTAQSIDVRILHAEHPLDVRVAELIEQKLGLIEATVDAAAQVAVPSVVQKMAEAIEKASATHATTLAAKEAAAAKEAQRIAALTAAGKPIDNTPRPPNEAEKTAIDGLARVAAADADRASEQNGVGFSRFDGELGHSLVATYFDRGVLTPKQWAAALRLAERYRRQIS